MDSAPISAHGQLKTEIASLCDAAPPCMRRALCLPLFISYRGST